MKLTGFSVFLDSGGFIYLVLKRREAGDFLVAQ
jgi:hypothetical protein